MNRQFLEDISDLIKSGDMSSARERLRAADEKKIPRALLADFCSLLRRTEMNVEVLKILRPIVRPGARSVAGAASGLELTEYAGALVRLGILTEPLRLLQTVDENKTPRSLLIQGFAYIAQSDYEKSGEVLFRFIEKSDSDPYERLIAQVNLLQGYALLGQLTLAEALIAELKEHLDPEKNKFLLATVYEFESEILRQRRRYRAAEKVAEAGLKLIGEAGTVDQLFLQKQKAVIVAQLSRDLKPLRHVRSEAFRLGHSDLTRECDLFESIFLEDRHLANKLYWGTPFQKYKERVLDMTKGFMQSKDFEIFRSDRRLRGETFALNSLRGFKPGQVQFRLFTSLLGDFYQRQTKTDLFEKIFPGEFFLHPHSNDRIQQALGRLKTLIANEKLPFAIEEKNGGYSLKPLNVFTLVRSDDKTIGLESTQHWFTIEEAQASWNVSWRTAHRRLSKYRAENLVEVAGRTRGMKFRFRK